MSFGIKVAQQGFDARKAPDYKLAYSSLWPTLKIIDQGSFKATDGQVVAKHNLGYVPMFLIFTKNRLDDPFSGPSVEGTSHLVDELGDSGQADEFFMDNTRLVFNTSNNVTAEGYYYIFNIDLEQNYQAPDVQAGATDQVDTRSDFGIDVVIPPGKVGSEDLRDYSVTSRGKAPLIHSVTFGTKDYTSTTPAISIKHDLGYAPVAFTYISSTPPGSGFKGSGRYSMLMSASNSFITTNKTTVESFIPSPREYSIIILKDPLFLV